MAGAHDPSVHSSITDGSTLLPHKAKVSLVICVCPGREMDKPFSPRSESSLSPLLNWARPPIWGGRCDDLFLLPSFTSCSWSSALQGSGFYSGGWLPFLWAWHIVKANSFFQEAISRAFVLITEASHLILTLWIMHSVPPSCCPVHSTQFHAVADFFRELLLGRTYKRLLTALSLCGPLRSAGHTQGSLALKVPKPQHRPDSATGSEPASHPLHFLGSARPRSKWAPTSVNTRGALRVAPWNSCP